jgi:hypothetical protein
MTVEEFIKEHDIKIRDDNHKRIVELFFGCLSSVTGNKKLLPDIIGQLLGIDLSSTFAKTGCFNGVFDDTAPPFENIDFYIRFQNDIRVYINGSILKNEPRKLSCNEYVLIILSDNLSGKIERENDGHYCIII